MTRVTIAIELDWNCRGRGLGAPDYWQARAPGTAGWAGDSLEVNVR
jgi:hypothetical protein